MSKQIVVDGRNVTVQIWDTAGQERFQVCFLVLKLTHTASGALLDPCLRVPFRPFGTRHLVFYISEGMVDLTFVFPSWGRIFLLLCRLAGFGWLEGIQV